MLKQQPWMHDSEALLIELDQLREEGKETAGLKEKVEAILAMPGGAEKEAAAAAFLDMSYALPVRPDSPYDEPSELSAIRAGGRGALRPHTGRLAGALRGLPAGQAL